jgi:iron complex outermembrane receptor protein
LDIVAGFYASWAWAEGPQHLTILDGFEIPLFTDGSLAGTVPALRSNVNENRRRDSSFAGYTQIRFDVTDFFALTAGARYTAETKRVDQRTTLTAPSFSHNINEFFGAPVRCDVGSPGTPSCVTYDVGRVVKDKSGRESYDAWTPMANLAFTPRRAWLPNGVDQALLYYNYAEGFKGGGVSTAEQNDPFDPEFAYSHEVGVRSTWWGNRLVANFSFFLTDYTDIQYTVLDVNPSSGIVERAQRNIAEAKLRGFEIELRANPIRHLRLRGSLGYIDADLVEFPDTISFSGTEPPGQCAGDIVINEGTGAGSCTIDRSDEDWYNTPKLTASASIEYNIPMGGLWGQLVPRVDFYFQDDVRYAASSTAFLSGRNTQDAFSLWSFRLTWYPDLWREGSKNLRISAFLDNAFDREYFNDGFDLAASFGSSGMYFGPPRTYGVTVRYDFP